MSVLTALHLTATAPYPPYYTSGVSRGGMLAVWMGRCREGAGHGYVRVTGTPPPRPVSLARVRGHTQTPGEVRGSRSEGKGGGRGLRRLAGPCMSAVIVGVIRERQV